MCFSNNLNINSSTNPLFMSLAGKYIIQSLVDVYFYVQFLSTGVHGDWRSLLLCELECCFFLLHKSLRNNTTANPELSTSYHLRSVAQHKTTRTLHTFVRETVSVWEHSVTDYQCIRVCACAYGWPVLSPYIGKEVLKSTQSVTWPSLLFPSAG